MIPSGSLLSVRGQVSPAQTGFEGPLTIASDEPYLGSNAPDLKALMSSGDALIKPKPRPDKWMKLALPFGNMNIGDSVTLDVNTNCSGSVLPSDLRRGVVKSKKTHMIIVADTANPANGFTTAQYDSMALEFDTLVWSTDSTNFGPPTDLDGNGHVVAFFTTAVNALSPPASSSVVLGFFASKDIFNCAHSNLGEMFYMLAPDPTGVVNSNPRSVSFVRTNTTGTLGHEFQHLINATRRTYLNGAQLNLEEGFLNEGLSHIAEELIFYKASGLTPMSNIPLSTVTATQKRVDAFNSFAIQNFSRLTPWLQRPDTTGAIKQNQNALAVRGSIWAFLRYATDRRNVTDQTFFFGLVNNANTGLANLDGAIGAGAGGTGSWLKDFTSAMYTDDAVTGIPTTLTQPSWNFRSFWVGAGSLGASYPLGTKPLTNGVLLNVGYSQGGSTTYDRFAVAASSFATALTTGGSTKWTLVVVRTK